MESVAVKSNITRTINHPARSVAYLLCFSIPSALYATRPPNSPLLLKPGLVSAFSFNPHAVLLASCTVVRRRSLTCFPSKLPPAARCMTAVLSLCRISARNSHWTRLSAHQMIRSLGFFHSTDTTFSGLVANPINAHMSCQLSISGSPSM
jgi:hypothetical protein